jgi:hypothetical protein
MKKLLTNQNAVAAPRVQERGGAGVNFLIVLIVLVLAGHAGYSYIPTAYHYEDFKQRMNELVVNAFAMPNNASNTPENLKQRIRRYADEYSVPADALIKVEKPDNGAYKARVQFTREINLLPFGIYKYKYEFDHTATPNSFLTK